MTFDGAMIYNPAGLADLSSGMLTFAHELDQIGQEVIARHGNVIDQASSNFQAADFHVGNSFQGA